MVFWAICSPERLVRQRSSIPVENNQIRLAFSTDLSKCPKNVHIYKKNVHQQQYKITSFPVGQFLLLLKNSLRKWGQIPKNLKLSSRYSPIKTQETIFEVTVPTRVKLEKIIFTLLMSKVSVGYIFSQLGHYVQRY